MFILNNLRLLSRYPYNEYERIGIIIGVNFRRTAVNEATTLKAKISFLGRRYADYARNKINFGEQFEPISFPVSSSFSLSLSLSLSLSIKKRKKRKKEKDK